MHTHECTNVCEYAELYLPIHLCICTSVYALCFCMCAYVCIWVCMCVKVRKHVCMLVCVYMNLHMPVHICSAQRATSPRSTLATPTSSARTWPVPPIAGEWRLWQGWPVGCSRGPPRREDASENRAYTEKQSAPPPRLPYLPNNPPPPPTMGPPWGQRGRGSGVAVG